MRKILLFVLLLELAHCYCPDGFELVRNGECRGKYTTMALYWNEAHDIVVQKCKEIEALPIIIHDEEDQTYWKTRGQWWIAIGLVCNTNSWRWEWADGSAVDYKPAIYNEALDKGCSTDCSWSLHNDDSSWYYSYDHKQYGDAEIWCLKKLPQPPNNGDGCDGFEDDKDDGVCYQIGATVENWQDAQKACLNFGANLASIHNSKENSFVRRLAVSQGVLNGLYLGATSSGKGNSFGWIDGTDWDYENFYSGFPINGLGDCVAMDTAGSTTGEWVNTDCNSTMSAACVRKPRSHACTNGPWTESQIVDVGKRVELEVVSLEANSCCDHLVLYENYIGGSVLADVTGEISNTTYRTKSSNFMRVSWNPNGGSIVRGAMMTFRAVSLS